MIIFIYNMNTIIMADDTNGVYSSNAGTFLFRPFYLVCIGEYYKIVLIKCVAVSPS